MMSKISHKGCSGLSVVILAQFALEMCLTAWNQKKSQ